jgi:hypothetical protein
MKRVVDLKLTSKHRRTGKTQCYVSFCTTLKPKSCLIARFRAIISKAMGLIGGAPGRMEDISAIALHTVSSIVFVSPEIYLSVYLSRVTRSACTATLMMATKALQAMKVEGVTATLYICVACVLVESAAVLS